LDDENVSVKRLQRGILVCLPNDGEKALHLFENSLRTCYVYKEGESDLIRDEISQRATLPVDVLYALFGWCVALIF
jgi:hypothetical protein